MKNIFKAIIIAVLTWEARMVLRRYKPQIVAITGNVGKTSAKDAIFAVLSGSLFVRKSEKSLNTEIGVPLTILGRESGWNNPIRWIGSIAKGVGLIVLPNHYPDWLVVEVGADKPGDIRNLAYWLKPDIAVITGVPGIPVHVEYFDSPEAVVKEKQALARAVKEGGTLVFNGDDGHLREMGTKHRGRLIKYGFTKSNDFVASDDEVMYEKGMPSGMRFRVDYADSSASITIHGALGKTHVYPALAALAVGVFVGLDMESMAKNLSAYTTPPGRMRILRGLKNSVIIDDSYNASPAAMISAIDTLALVRSSGQKIAALGDMRELGRYSKEAHERVGEHVAKIVDILVTVGEESRVLAKAAIRAGLSKENVFQYKYGESALAGKDLKSMLQAGNIVLVKGSQNMIRMERLVKEIMAEPLRAKKLLVRQEKEWLGR